mmetsp:Transcript_44054/g.135979  ORF Transcript_44054/g.135979 Transcript_44054/m.135979 type:complete len:380 (+) Transcript_44054:71-1210(+)
MDAPMRSRRQGPVRQPTVLYGLRWRAADDINAAPRDGPRRAARAGRRAGGRAGRSCAAAPAARGAHSGPAAERGRRWGPRQLRTAVGVANSGEDLRGCRGAQPYSPVAAEAPDERVRYGLRRGQETAPHRHEHPRHRQGHLHPGPPPRRGAPARGRNRLHRRGLRLRAAARGRRRVLARRGGSAVRRGRVGRVAGTGRARRAVQPGAELRDPRSASQREGRGIPLGRRAGEHHLRRRLSCRHDELRRRRLVPPRHPDRRRDQLGQQRRPGARGLQGDRHRVPDPHRGEQHWLPDPGVHRRRRRARVHARADRAPPRRGRRSARAGDCVPRGVQLRRHRLPRPHQRQAAPRPRPHCGGADRVPCRARLQAVLGRGCAQGG